MKQRIISSLIGLPILFLVFAAFGTIVPNIAVAALAALAVWELLHATGCLVNKRLTVYALLFSASIPFFSYSVMSRNLAFLCYAYVLLLCITLLQCHNKLHVQQVAVAFMFSLLIPFSLTTLIYMRDQQGTTAGILYALIVFGSSWLSDTGAYFTGRFLGKHKMAPVISPKKTVEGAIGGAITATILVPLVVMLCAAICAYFGNTVTIYYGRLICLVPFFSGVSILGDLFASIIKRQFHIKDYGSIMPGHGGVMDRFDSVLMVAPLVFLASKYLPLVTH